MKWLQAVSEKCIECSLCQKECAFLEIHGMPKPIADAFLASPKDRQSVAFECSLCGLCTAVCPVGVDPAAMFLEMRQDAVDHGGGNLPEHRVILDYERRGTSRRYTWYGLPGDCDMVFFPGCNLPGTRPARVMQLYECLRGIVPALGIVLDCCMKPSHDLGRERVFRKMFTEMREWLLENGVRTVLVACPNCHKVFREHGRELLVKTVYEILAQNRMPRAGRQMGKVVVHDPCAVRFEQSIHGAVRDLVKKMGLTIQDMPHQGEKTLCCGEGGSVGFLKPEFAKNWRSLRKEETSGQCTITYCAGCAGSLGAVMPTSHVLDLIFEPEATLSGKVKTSRAPFTYWNRIRLKARFKRLLATAPAKRERTFSPD